MSSLTGRSVVGVCAAMVAAWGVLAGGASGADTGVYVSVHVTEAPTPKAQATPVAGVKVKLYSPAGRVYEGTTDSTGRYVFTNLPKGTRPIDYRAVVTYAGQTQTLNGHHLTFKFVVR